MKTRTIPWLLVALVALVAIGTGCAGRKQPKMLPETTVEGLPPLSSELARKVTCVTEEFPATCLDAETGSEHCKYMLRHNAKRTFQERLETLTTLSVDSARDSEAMKNAIRVLDEFGQKTTFFTQQSFHESNLFRQSSSHGDVFLLRMCVINDEALNHLLRSLKEKAEEGKRDDIAEYAEMLLDSWYDGKPPDRKKVEETTGQLYAHFADLYNNAFRDGRGR